MHFSTIVALVASTFAATAAAAPLAASLNGYHPRGGHKHRPAANQCSESQQASCCNSADGVPALGLQCAVNVLGGSCTGSVQCCSVGGNGGLIALNLCVPISV